MTRHTARSGPLVALAAVLATLAARPATAQVPTLDRVDSLVVAGHYDDARATLDRWWSAREAFEVPGSNRARALMLRARLAPDPETAEPDYLAVVLGYPTSTQAPEALLRLGQGLLADGDASRAAAYLQRLVADYPGRPQRTLGLLWLARAHSATRRYSAACQAARLGLEGAENQADMMALLQVEAGAACGVTAGDRVAATPTAEAAEPRRDTAAAPPRQARADSAPPRRAPVDPAPARPTAEGETGRFTVQSGAFRYPASADELVQRLRARGYEPRTVLVPANALLRVRVGRFATAAEAAALVSVLKSEGFDAIVVADAREERSP